MSDDGHGFDREGFDRKGFASAFLRFVDTMNIEATPPVSPVREIAEAVLGADPSDQPVVSEEVAVYDQPNLQLALERWIASDAPQRRMEVHGLAAPGMRFMGLELGDLVSRGARHSVMVELGPVQYTEVGLPDGRRLLCYESALLSVTDGDRRLVVLLARGQQRGPGAAPLQVQVMARERGVATDFLAELRRLRHEVNVYRGHVLAVTHGDEHNPFGGDLSLTLVGAATLVRDDVVLPDGVLDRVERHTIEFGRHAERLREAGRALRRGVLLYGPPGTGKTHTVQYLCSAMAGRTTFVISGAAFGVLAPICQLARDLSPAMVVLEDVDLVAHERTMMGPGSSPLLFMLMNEMDGIGPDADVVFLLTTNRADLIEQALAARPGRIDLAVEIPLPDASCRRRLIELYGRGIVLRLDDVDAIVARTEGVSAAFVKELLRRAALIAATATATSSDPPSGPLVVGDGQMNLALDEMLGDGDRLTRAILGAAIAHDGPEAGLRPPRVEAPPHLGSP